MNYKRIYDELINRAINSKRSKTEQYYERHHIVPKSLGGDNSKDNLVLLTAREHFIAHKLLVNIYKNIDKDAYHKMNHALFRFLYSKNSPEYKINSKEYERIRIKHAQATSHFMSGRVFSKEAKNNMSAAQKLYFKNNPGHFLGKKHTEQTKIKMSEIQSGAGNPQYGLERPDDVKQKISNTMKGHKKSASTVAKFKSRTLDQAAKDKISAGLKQYHAKRKANKNG